MDSTTPAHPASAMSHGGTFMRPGAVGWGGQPGALQPGMLQPELGPAVIEHALAAAAKDPDRVTDLLDELSRGRLWLPLPEDERPVTDGSAVLLPTVMYLGAEFVPAFTSARQLAAWHGRGRLAGQASAAAQQLPDDPAEPQSPDGPFAAMPHIVVPAAELARLLPSGMGIALNPGAEASVPIYPEGVGDLAAACGSRRRRPGPGGPAAGRPGHAAGRDPRHAGRHTRGPAGLPGLAVGTRRRRGPGHLGHAARPGFRSHAPPGHQRARAGRQRGARAGVSRSTSPSPARASRTSSTSGSPRRPSPSTSAPEKPAAQRPRC